MKRLSPFFVLAGLALLTTAPVRAATYHVGTVPGVTLPTPSYANLNAVNWNFIQPGDVIVLYANDDSLLGPVNLTHVNGVVTFRSSSAEPRFITAGTPPAGGVPPPPFSLFTTNSAIASSELVLNNVAIGANTKTGPLARDSFGAAVFNTNGQKITGLSSSFTGNAVVAGINGGARGGALYTDGVASLNGIGFSGNMALGHDETALTWNDAAHGGAVYATRDIVFGSGAWAQANYVESGGLVGTLVATGGANSALGGALHAVGDVTFATGASLSNNHASVYDGGYASARGGAVYAGGSAVFGPNANLSGNWVQAGAAGLAGPGALASAHGGAVYTRDGGVVFGDNTQITLNNARAFGDAADTARGGAIYAGGALADAVYSGAAVYAGANVLLTNNIAEVQGQATGGGLGGAVYADGDIRVGDKLTATGNRARGGEGNDGGRGGALHATGGVALGANAFFKQNEASAPAGDNTARGGALYAAANVVTGNAASFEDNRVIVDTPAGVPVVGGENAALGGAVYAGGHATFGDLSSFAGNRADAAGNRSARGGAVYAAGDVAFGQHVVVRDNQALHRGGDQGAHGGGVYAGGAVAFGDGAVVTGNKADGTLGGDRSGLGGGVHAGTGLSFGVDAALSGNEAVGGALLAGGGGGGAYTAGGKAVFGLRAQIASNTAIGAGQGAGFGGGVAADGPDGVVEIGDGSRVVQNQAVNTGTLGGGALGGGVYARNGAHFGAGVEVSGNQALATGDGAALGGGVHAVNGVVVFGDNATISANSAQNSSGAAAALGGGLYSGTAVTLGDGALVDGNQALSAGGADSGLGGGIHSVTGPVIVGANARFTGNRAIGDGDRSAGGGAVYSAGGNIVFASGATIAGNAAVANGGDGAGRGGALHVAGSGTTVILGDNALVRDNSAQGSGIGGGLGGAVYTAGNFAVGHDALFVGNSAFGNAAAGLGGQGGAAWIADNVEVLGGTTFVGNTASAVGGALYVENGATTFLNADTGDIVFRENTAAGRPNAIHFENTGGHAALRAVTADGRFIHFEDPLSANAANGPLTVIVEGAGTTRFANHQSDIFANTEIRSGTLWLDRGAVYGAGDPAGNAGLAGTVTVSTHGILRLAANPFTGAHAQLRADRIDVRGVDRLTLSDGAASALAANTAFDHHDLLVANRFDNLAGLSIHNRLTTATFVDNTADPLRPVLRVVVRDLSDVFDVDETIDIWRLNPAIDADMRGYLDHLYNTGEAPSSAFRDFAGQFGGASVVNVSLVHRQHLRDLRQAFDRRQADFHVMSKGPDNREGVFTPLASTDAFAMPAMTVTPTFSCGGSACGRPACNECGAYPTGSVWLQASQHWTRQEARDGIEGYDYDPRTLALGYDHRWGSLQAGGAFQYAWGELESTDAGRTRTEVDSALLGAFVTYAASRWYVDLGVEGGWGWNKVSTQYLFWGPEARTHGSFDTWSLGADAEIGGVLVWEDGCGDYPTLLTPHTGVALDYVRSGAFDETGLVSLTRRFEGHSRTNTEVTAGLKLEKSFQSGRVRWTPEADLVYGYQFGPTAPEGLTAFTALPGFGWDTRGIDVGRHLVRFNLGLRANLGERWELGIHYDLEARRRYYDHQLRAGLAFDF